MNGKRGPERQRLDHQWLSGGALGTALLLGILGGCGGGGGGVNSTPAPAPPPTTPPPTTPPPVPTPTATPAATFQTSEYYRSDGPQQHNAITAWQQGANGTGETIAIIDSGIDMDSPEFTGRISSASASIAGNPTIQAESDHGTDVAMFAAAARDNTGIMGIAWNATLQVLRADVPGSCADTTSADPGCKFTDQTIAAGVDRAIAAKARVINLSLGGALPGSVLDAAIGRAAAAGIVVVVAAGNGGASTDPGDDPNDPDPFASGIRASGNGNVIIVGSVDKSGTISSFSNRAGTEQQWFMTADGEQVCCSYDNGVMKVTTDSVGNRYVEVVSGTSFAAPQVAGAVALLAQAFPNLTATQIVDILLNSARDAGDGGTDATYGHGVLDIARAFEAQGTTTLAGSGTAIPVGDSTVVTSAAMGDAAIRQSGLGAVILDRYARAYSYDLGAAIRIARVTPRLYGALSGTSQSVALGGERAQIALTVDPRSGGVAPLNLTSGQARQARVLAATMIAQAGPSDRLAFGFHQGAEALAGMLRGGEGAPFLIAGTAGGAIGDEGYDRTALAWRRDFAGWGVTGGMERQRLSPGAGASAFTLRPVDRQDTAYALMLKADRRAGPFDLALGLNWLAEDRTIMGARFQDAFGSQGSDTLFADLSLGWAMADGWRLSGTWRQGWVRPRSHGLISGGEMRAQAFSVDFTGHGVFVPGDTFGLRFAQPLRVTHGGVALYLPVSYDYATLETTYADRMLSLAPRGRELDEELAWRGGLWGGSAGISLFLRRQPDNIAAAPMERGWAVSWSRGF